MPKQKLERFGSSAVKKVLRKGLPGLQGLNPPKNGVLSRKLQEVVAKKGY